jgi:thiol:disulfide interchange protein
MFFRKITTALLLFLSLGLSAQFASPVSWDFSYEQTRGDEYNLIITATADENWNIYSQFTPEGGPIPTSLAWTKGDHFELIGRAEETGHKKSGMDDMFGVDVIKFLSDKPYVMTQKVKIKDYGTPIQLDLEYMCCDDEQCLPPTEEDYAWSIPVPAKTATPASTPVSTPVSTPTPAEKGNGNSLSSGGGSAGGKADPAPQQTPSAPAAAATKTNAQKEGKMDTEEAPASAMETYTARGLPSTDNDPMGWVFTADKLSDNQYRLNMTGVLDRGWSIYGIETDPETGAIPTIFVINAIEGVEAVGKATETGSGIKEKFDKTWEAVVPKVKGEVTYSQLVNITGKPVVEGFVEYQACDHEMCFPPREIPFVLDLSGPTPFVSIDGLDASGPTIAAPATAPTVTTNELGISTDFDPTPAGDCSVGAAQTSGKSLLAIFGLGLLGGIFALLMPCIFPMIPLTVSFFTKSGGTKAEGIRKAGLYGFFIFLIYVLLSAPFHLLDGLDPSILNTIASSVWLNLIFFVVFIFFAGSFFGFYELTLPESWSNRASSAEGSGGIAGIFFMALTLALVSFSCTGPILGSLLVEAVSGGAWPLTAGMAGFGVALGLPFALFAAFPGFLNSMPKSGGWLNSVKVVLGFVEVALAFKFLSTADLVGKWDLLKLEPFLLVWILCAAGIAAYLLGIISFPLDSKKRKIGPIAIAIAVAAIGFTGYLGIGLTQDNDTGTYTGRKVLSGIAPPVCYNYFLPCDEGKNITPFKSLEEGLAYARKVNKPVMLDFTGDACVNCRKMEEHVWTEDNIKRYLTDEYVIVSLYVDDREELPESEHKEVDRMDGTGRTRMINTVGKKWQYLQQTVYAKSSQPYYVLVSPDGTTLNPPVAYTPDVDDYEKFLECGLATYKSLKSK